MDGGQTPSTQQTLLLLLIYNLFCGLWKLNLLA